MNLYLVQIQLDPAAFIRFLQSQGLNQRDDEDLGYGVHAWLAACFGNLAPQPFRLFMATRDNRPPKVLGYTPHPHSVLTEHAKSFADPFIFSVCDFEHHMDSRQLPNRWNSDSRLGFEVLTCPVGRKADSGIEKDVYLLRADNLDSDAGLSRELVYREWLESQLGEACGLEKIELKGFRLVRQIRASRSPKDASPRQLVRLTRPQALIRGILTVRNEENFHQLLARGIGRHRAFGYGMLLLRPAR